jgi:hypothetical protein
MSKSRSPSNARWSAIDAILQHFGTIELRKFFASSVKFLIPPTFWGDQHPKSEFDDDPAINSFHKGFDDLSKDEMRGEAESSAEDKALINLIRRAANPSHRSWSKRVAGRKTTRLRREMQKRFVKYSGNEKGSLRGLRFYESLIRSTYFKG